MEEDFTRYEKKSVKVFLKNKFKYEGYVLNVGVRFLTLLDEKTQKEVVLSADSIASMEVVK